MNGITDKITERLLLLLKNETKVFFANSKFHESITVQELGDIGIPTGKIVACDPLVCPETLPFDKQVKAGRYPVTLYIHCIDDDKRVGFAKLSFSDKLPSRFELAVNEEQDLDTLKEGYIFGYGVDSGTGCFMDEAAAKKVAELMDSAEDYNIPELEDELEKTYVDTYCTANFRIPDTDLDLAAFSSGYGDGAYPTYWGFDEENNICCLITDFETVDYDLD